MYRPRWFILGALVLVAAMATSQQASAQAIQIKAAPGDLPPDHMVMSLWNSPVLRDAVLKELKLELVEQYPDQRGYGGQVLRVKDTDGNLFNVVVSFSLRDGDDKNATSIWGISGIYHDPTDAGDANSPREKEISRVCAKMTEAWARQLESALREFAAEGVLQDTQQAKLQLDLASARLSEAAQEQEKLRNSLHDAELQVSMPAAVLQTQLSEAMSQLQSLELELAGLQARRDAIEEQLVKVQAETAKNAEEDEVAAQLQNVVETHQRQLELMKQQVDVGKATPIELEMVKSKLATAKAELAEAKRDAMKSESGTTLDWLRNELAQCVIRQQECLGKQTFSQKRAQELGAELRTESMLLQPLREKCSFMARRVDSLESAKQSMEQQLQLRSNGRQVQVRLLMPRETEVPAEKTP